MPRPIAIERLRWNGGSSRRAAATLLAAVATATIAAMAILSAQQISHSILRHEAATKRALAHQLWQLAADNLEQQTAPVHLVVRSSDSETWTVDVLPDENSNQVIITAVVTRRGNQVARYSQPITLRQDAPTVADELATEKGKADESEQ